MVCPFEPDGEPCLFCSIARLEIIFNRGTGGIREPHIAIILPAVTPGVQVPDLCVVFVCGTGSPVNHNNLLVQTRFTGREVDLLGIGLA